MREQRSRGIVCTSFHFKLYYSDTVPCDFFNCWTEPEDTQKWIYLYSADCCKKFASVESSNLTPKVWIMLLDILNIAVIGIS
ncbi:hypothetical protein SUGI_0560860 [Cryptomeria japonica]|nr:hypothetical protein SUGI_0560860 [Cryptomeria japonica]